MRLSNLKSLMALLFAFALVAAACSGDDAASTDDGGSEETTATTEEAMEEEDDAMEESDDEAMEEEDSMEEAMVDLSGTSVVITGSERDETDVGAINAALKIFADENGMDSVTFSGSAEWEADVNVQVEAGSPPDISFFPQPGKLADFARSGAIQALPEHTAGLTSANWSDAWTVFGNVDGTQYGIPTKNDLKSLVWYKPARFAELGYDVPSTFDDFVALVGQANADGNTPLCVGIESGNATGWLFTDWVEEMMLRFEGADVYDQWVNHEIPFDDPRVVAQMQAVLDLWSTDGNVFAAGGTIASSHHSRDGSQSLLDNDCLMHRQASFAAGQFPEGAVFADGSADAVDVFYFPANDGAPVLGAGTLAAAFEDRPEVWAVMDYLSSPEYAQNRQVAQSELTGGGVSGFLSAVKGLDQGVYTPLEASFLEILATADVVRFDGSDLMPSAVGAGTFWTEGTSAVNGEIDAATAAANIEASWP